MFAHTHAHVQNDVCGTCRADTLQAVHTHAHVKMMCAARVVQIPRELYQQGFHQNNWHGGGGGGGHFNSGYNNNGGGGGFGGGFGGGRGGYNNNSNNYSRYIYALG